MHPLTKLREVTSYVPTAEFPLSYSLSVITACSALGILNHLIVKDKSLDFLEKISVIVLELGLETWFLYDQSSKLDTGGMAAGSLIIASSLVGLSTAANNKVH